MAKFIFEMPDELAEAVEAYRVKRGLKATAEAVRLLLRAGLDVDSGPVRGRAAFDALVVPALQLGPVAIKPGSRLKVRR